MSKVLVFMGAIFTLLTIILGFVFYGNVGGTIEVNGEIVSQAEFNSLLWPKILLGAFAVIGLLFLFFGIRKIFKDKKTDKYGEMCFGKIFKVYESGTYVNGKAEYKADFLVFIPSLNTTKTFSEVIGYDPFKYPLNSFVSIKHYNNDINICGVIDENNIPSIAKNMLAIVNTIFPSNVEQNPIENNINNIQ